MIPRTLQARLEAVPHRFDGLQALRLTELGAARLGTFAAPDAEPVRVVAEQGLVFAAAPIAAIEPGEGRSRVRSAFLGLTGPLGVMPQAYSELVARADRLRNRSVAAFLDLFNHRLTSLFLRASEKYRLGALVQRSVTPPPGTNQAGMGTDPVSRAMLAVAGFGTPHVGGRLAVADEVILYYAGLFGARNRPAVALESMLADYLGLPAAVEQFSGRWLPIDPAERTALPVGGFPAPFTRLGVDAVAGSQVWDPQAAFRIVVGPVRRADMHALMPTGRLLRRLVDLVRAYAGPDLAFDVQVILRREDVPDLHMRTDDSPAAPRLGWNTWAKGLPALEDKDDIILDPDRLPPFGRVDALATKDRT